MVLLHILTMNIQYKKKPLSRDRGGCLDRCFCACSHLLAARLVETEIKVVVLTLRTLRITVAGQCRTLTGFAIKPSHPGEGYLELLRIRFVKCYHVKHITILEFCISRNVSKWIFYEALLFYLQAIT